MKFIYNNLSGPPSAELIKILDFFIQVIGKKFLIDCIEFVEEPSSKEENTTVKNSVDSIGLSPVNERKTAMQSPLRKVLSPIHSNIIPEPLKEQSSKDQCSLLYAPNTPQTPSMTSATNKFPNVGTPLDKFNAWNSNLKVFLCLTLLNFY